MIGRSQLGLAICGLLAANLLIDVGQVGYALQPLPGAGIVRRAEFGIRESQVLLLGCWLALGDAKWHTRLLISIPLTICVAMSEGWASAISPTAWRLYGGDSMALRDAILKRSVMHSCWFLAMLLTAFVVLLPLRRLGQWRLTRQATAESSTRLQFSAADVLLWLAPIGGVLATVRLLLSFGKEEIGPNRLFLILGPVSVAPLVAGAVVAAFAIRRRLIAWIALIGLTLLIAGGFAIAERYRLLSFYRAAPTGFRLPPRMASQLYWGPIEVLCIYWAAMFVALLNCLALQMLGWRLVRPAWHSTAAEKTQDD